MVFVQKSAAQCVPEPSIRAGDRDTCFRTGGGVDGVPVRVLVQNNGRILASGRFGIYQGGRVSGLLRVLPDGTRDHVFYAFSLGFNEGVNDIALQPDQKIIAVGAFVQYDILAPAPRIVRINPDGTRDLTFNVGTGFDSHASCVKLLPDGKVLVGGGFSKYQDKDCPALIRLNPDGSRDTTFKNGAGASAGLETIEIQPDGKILVGSMANTLAVRQCDILRLHPDGSLDSSFARLVFYSSFTTSNSVANIQLQPDGRVLIAGSFSSVGGKPRRNIARLLANGRVDSSFITPAYKGGTGSLLLAPNGKIYTGLRFALPNGDSTRFMTRLMPNGSVDTTFRPYPQSQGLAVDLALQPDGKLLVAGNVFSGSGPEGKSVLRLWTETIPVAARPEPEKQPLRLTPNPAASLVQIETEAPVASVQIVSMDGRVYPERAVSTGNMFSAEDLPAGLYTVIAETRNGKRIKSRLAVAR